MKTLILLLLLASAPNDDDFIPKSLYAHADGSHIRTRPDHDREYFTGPRGGIYYITPAGRKKYLRRN